MKFTEDENYENNNYPSYTDKNVVDEDQNILLDNLQAAIDTIDDRITELSNQLQSDYTNLEGLVNQSGVEITLATSQAVNALRDELNTLEASYRSAFVTDLTRSDKVETEHLEATLADIDTANIGTESVGNSEIDNAKINNAEIESSVQKLINATKIIVNELEADTLTYNRFSAIIANITILSSSAADIKTMVSKSISTELVAPDYAKYWQPNTFPQNDELLVINVPQYDGEVKLTDLNGLFSISVINNGLVTYSSVEGLVYAVTFDDFGTHIYFDSVGKTVKYSELHIGKKQFDYTTSEIIEKSAVSKNTPDRFGAVSRSPIDINADSGWNVVVVDELPEHPVNNTMYVIDGVGCIYYTNDTAYPITYVFNLDYEMDDDNPIRMTWDSTTSTLSVEVLYEDSANTDIDLSFVGLGQYLPPEGPMYEDDENSDINFDFME